MSRVESASGANYSSHNEQSRKFEPIAPVGTNYTPVGKVDIATLRKGPAAGPSGGVPTLVAKPPIIKSAAPLYGGAGTRVDAWPEETASSIQPPPPPPPPPPAIPSAPRPAFSVSFCHPLSVLFIYFIPFQGGFYCTSSACSGSHLKRPN
jgi:drebrin-like protein